MSKLTTSSVLGGDCKALAHSLLLQPELLAGVFSDSKPALPESQQVIHAAKEYTGERSTMDDQRLLMVGALHYLGATDRDIAKSCGCSRHSIPLIIEALEKSGRVAPLKERLLLAVSRLAEKSGRALGELLDEVQDGKRTLELASMVKAVGQVHSFQIEKYQLLTGQATERIDTVVGVGRAEIESFLKSAATPISAEIAPADCKSSGLRENPSKTLGVHLDDTFIDTRLAPSTVTLDADRLGLDTVPTRWCRAGGGGGRGGGGCLDLSDRSTGFKILIVWPTQTIPQLN